MGFEGEKETATFVFADLAGYTALTEAHGDEQAADAAAELSAAVRGLLDDYGAEEVKAIGDALLVRVPDPTRAMHFAARIVGDFGARHRSLGICVGMHTGTAVRRDDDWFGAAVNVASRIADVASSGEVLISAATKEAAGDPVLPGQLRRRGRRELKNVRDPVELFALVPEAEGDRRDLPIDPVCRMAVDPALGREHAVHRGVQHHFCSAACAQAFRDDPERYASKRSGRSALLVSDEARERAAGRLGQAYAKGRLEPDELDERTEIVWSARTRADLRAATHDLPSRRRTLSPWLWPFWPMIRLVRLARRRFQGD